MEVDQHSCSLDEAVGIPDVTCAGGLCHREILLMSIVKLDKSFRIEQAKAWMHLSQ